MNERLNVIIATLKCVMPANYDSMKFLVASINELENMVKENANGTIDKADA